MPPFLHDVFTLAILVLFICVPIIPIGMAIYYLTRDPEIPLRCKIRHYVFVFLQWLCNMHVPATKFNRARFERISSLSPDSGLVPAEKETKVHCEDVHISKDVWVRVFRDKNQQPTQERPLTCLLYIHGGGFTVLHANSHPYHSLCRSYALSGPFVVVSVEYRLSPEHRFPIPVADSHAALQWCATTDHPLLQDCGAPAQRRICLAGDSAGGNLSAVLSVLARDGLDADLKAAPKVNIAHTLLIYPTLNMLDTPSRRNMTNAYILNKDVLDFFYDSYLGDYNLPATQEVRLAPHTASTLKNLPPATIITAVFDPLVDDGRRYATMLKENGVPCNTLEYRTIHGFFTMLDLPEAHAAFQESLPFLLPQ